MRSAKKTLRAVLDTNLVVSGLFLKRGLPHELVSAARRGGFLLVLTPALGEEYQLVLQRPKFAHKYALTRAEVSAFLNSISALATKARPRSRLPIKPRDPKDEMVLAAALGGKADYLVTGDDHLLELRSDPRMGTLQIVTAREFLEILTHVLTSN